jgi:replicative DNA helicase
MSADELTPPADIGAERQIVGAALHDQRIIDDIADLLDPEDFYRPAHEAIWRAILAQRHANEPVDAALVKDRLLATGDLERVGGAAYLFDLVQGTITTANATHHAGIVARYAGQRRLITAGTRITQLAYSAEADNLADTQERARVQLDQAITGGANPETVTWIGDDIDDTLDALETTTELLGTCWADLDHVIGGLAPGRLYVVGARPGVGKTVVGVQLAHHHAKRHEQAVVMATLEMSRREIEIRLLAQMAKVDFGNLERRQLTDDDWSRIARVRGELANLPLAVRDGAAARLADIRRYARAAARRRNLGLVVVDYLQLMQSPPVQRPRHEVVAEFSRGLKLLARELEIPVVAMSQLNRASEARHDKTPNLADLRESGAVEQDADVVLLLHRDMHDDAKRADLHVAVAKNRHGSVGNFTLQFEGHLQRAVQKSWRPSDVLGGAA